MVVVVLVVVAVLVATVVVAPPPLYHVVAVVVVGDTSGCVTSPSTERGGVRVVNRGFSEEESKWKQSEGKAYFVDKTNEGYLKVSFFGPFYGSYVVFELDKENYQYAFVSGPNTKYLWLLARTPSVEPELIENFIKMAKARGFDTDNLIYVEHSSRNPS